MIIIQPALGLSIAVSIRVGNELGAGNPLGAKRASYTAVAIVCKLFLKIGDSTHPNFIVFCSDIVNSFLSSFAIN